LTQLTVSLRLTIVAKPEIIARVAPILRGLLAQPTGDDDRPHRPVILESHIDTDALAFAAACQRPPRPLEPARAAPLQLEALRGNEPDEELRTRLASAYATYKAAHRVEPETILLTDVAVFQVVGSAPTRGQDLRLAGRVAVVTGAAGAIGYGICKGLLEHGAHVAITDLAGEKLDQFVAEFQAHDAGRTFGVPMDVTDPASVAHAFAQIIAHWGGVDIIVLNAGIALACPLVEMSLEAFRRLERVNTEGTLLVLAEAGRLFARQNLGGDVVLISSKNVFAPGAGFGAYSATKAAAHQLARIASLEFAPLGIRVNMVAPDAVFSGGTHKSGLWAEVGPGRMKARGLDEKGLEDYYRNRNLLKAKVTAEHVANAVLFFALRQTPTTGACIPVDGGLPDATPR
jgi:NAD(P)-dependent dehydrogenase (short-subunit alcohol dehydrogenase family)